jgi:ribosomal protein S18 acetylase RimI-like enzyme
LNSNLLTRLYTNSDWDEVRIIHDLARPIELEGSCDPRAFVPLADDEKDLKEFQQCQKLVACLDDRITGFVGIDGGRIGWLYVNPADTGCGIGRYLVRTALDRLKNKASVYVLDGNSRAIKLYQSEGFTIVSSFKSDNNGYTCTVLKMSEQGDFLSRRRRPVQ